VKVVDFSRLIITHKNLFSMLLLIVADICAKITSQNQTEHRLVCLDRPSSGLANGKKPDK
jgi:hypothetical protein